MARTKNVAILIGRLGKDAEMRYTPAGKAVMALNVATDHNYKRGDEWVNDTDWHSVELWGDAAERLNGKALKGMMVYVMGEIRYDKWEGDDGTMKHRTKIWARDVTLLEKGQAPDEPEAEEFQISIPIM